MLPVLVNLVVALLAAAAAVLAAGGVRWNRLTRARRAALEAGCRPPAHDPFGPHHLAGLPDPVARYLSLVLDEGQPAVGTVRLEHTGEFRMNSKPTGWRPFRSVQWVTVSPPGMLWNARIRLNPALVARVHDAYHGGDGLLHAALLGLVTVARRTGSVPLAEGELMRWLAEAVWYPTALLPASGVRWEAIDASRARASITDRGVTASVEFGFGEDGLIASVHSPARYRGEKEGVPQYLPWTGRFWSYGTWAGQKIPVEGEVAWVVDGEEVAYWRGRIQAVSYR